MDPKSRSTMRVPWHWLKLAAVAAAAALAGWLALEPGNIALTLVPVTAGVVSATALGMAVLGTTRRRVFMSCHARVPLLELELDQPDPTRFEKFITHLEQRIDECQKERKLERNQSVAGEMRMLRRLSETGVFEPETYQAARTKLLDKF